MRRQSISSWVPWAVPGFVGLALVAACSVSAEPEGEHAGLGEASGSVAPEHRSTLAPVASYAFFTATRMSGGSGYFTVAAVNGEAFTCGRYAATSCTVAAVDISALGLSATDSQKILGLIGKDSTAPQLLFVGSVTGGDLVAQEVWRAPAAISLPYGATMFHVSHSPSQALVVNDWSSVKLATLDYTYAPEAKQCNGPGDDGGVVLGCAFSYFPVTSDAVSPTGVVVVGASSRSAFEVEQYFLKISTGYHQEGDGYSFCYAGELLCSNNHCYQPEGGSCNSTHWAGRGESPMYSRATSSNVESWLIQTGQLQQGDIPPN